MGEEVLKYTTLFPENKKAWIFELIVLCAFGYNMTMPMNYPIMFLILGCMIWLIISLSRTFTDVWSKTNDTV